MKRNSKAKRQILYRLWLAVLFVFLPCSTPDVFAQSTDILKTLRREHPRLYVTGNDLEAVRQNIKRDAHLRHWYELLNKEAEKMLSEPTVSYKLIGPRLLQESRAALKRISTLAGLYKLNGDERFAARARQEMLAATALPDWNPRHFLDVAEMTNALAIGYDWLFDYLSKEDKAIVSRAIVEKGLTLGIEAYRNGEEWTGRNQRVRWYTVDHNWNQVCNGGLLAGALAIADEEPQLASEFINNSLKAIELPMKTYAPDGGYVEGPAYWNYGTSYNVYYLSAFETALQTDSQYEKETGFAETGLFRLHSISPIGKTFNYADGGEGVGAAAQMMWLAKNYNLPAYAEREREIAKDEPSIFHLLWSSKLLTKKDFSLPLAAFFKKINVAYFRGSWTDKNAFFVGFKGGDNKANHSHLDLGTFVLDALGERWAVDLGGDDYNLPGYFDPRGPRWQYYRLNTHGQNTVLVDGANQSAQAAAPIVAFDSKPAKAFAVADLTAGYAPKVQSLKRGVALINRNQVWIQDEIKTANPVEIRWQMHTRAKIEIINPRKAKLVQNGAQIEAEILSPSDARFDIASASPPPPQAQQPHVTKLLVRLPSKTVESRIVITFTQSGRTATSRIESLENWINKGRKK